MMNCGKLIYNWSKCFEIPFALMLCLGTVCVSEAHAQVSPNATTNSSDVIVNFITTNATPLNPGFNGFNHNLQNAVESFDVNFQQMVTSLSPGWLRYPGGTESEAFDWVSGKIIPAWVDGLSAKAYTHDVNAAALPIVNGKGGSLFSDYARLAANVGGAKIIVSVNAYTDTPQSAQAFAQYALTNHIPVAAWELANEPYTWLKTAGEPGAFFTDATDYASKMRPYRDAIKAADPNAVVTLYFSEAGNPTKSWDNALASYNPKYWDAVTYHEYVFPGSLTDFNDLMAAANGNLFSNTTSYVTEYLAPKNNPDVMYVISEVSPAGGQGGPLLGTLYGGIYTTEFALRMSTLPQVKYVAAFQMLSNGGIDQTNGNVKVVEDAYAKGTTVNTSGLNFGFFLSAQAAGEAVANGALRNSTRVYATTVTGGPTAPRDGGVNIPAIYAQTYEGGNGKRYVVLTNKGESAATAQITQDGAALTNALQMTFVSGADPTLRNSGPAASPVQIQTQAVPSPGSVTIPPYSVSRLEWSATLTPQIGSGGIVIHSGSSAAVSPGAIVDIYGTNLASVPLNAPVGATLPSTLGGVEVTVNGNAAPLLYVGPLQLIFQMPYETALGIASVVVVNNNVSSAPAPVMVQQAAPFILTYNTNRAIVVNQNGTVNGSGSGARPGSFLTAYLIGSGPLDNPIASGAPASASPLSKETLNTTVTVGNSAPIVPQFAGMAPGFAGLMQLNFVTPNLPPGDYPMLVSIGGTVSNQPLLTISQ